MDCDSGGLYNDGNKSETTLFAEHEQAHGYVSALISDATNTTRLDALSSLRSILDRYLEARTLLDPYLATLVTPLGECCENHLASDDYACAMSAIYYISKVRGRKRIMRFLPHSVDLIEPVLADLIRLSSSLSSSSSSSEASSVVRTNNHDSSNDEGQKQHLLQHQGDDPPLWERIYVLWMWLELLSLTPFDRRVVLPDSTVLSLIQWGKLHLSDAGPIRDTAAACLASWLSRQDMDDNRNEFCEWSRGILEDCVSRKGKSHDVFRPLGILQTLAATLNVGTRSNYQAQMILWPCMLGLAEQHRHPNVLVRKYLTKWLARMGCAHMPPRIASWRYQRGGRTSLLENLLGKSDHDKEYTDESDHPLKDHNEEELFEVPDAVEDVMGHLLLALKDNATVVRWSAAKGIGRLTERLPIMCVHDVLDALVEQLKRNTENDMVWHGSCLALGELARRGLLLPDRLPDVIEPILVPAILFDVRKGQTSVGSHVRDSACYAYWAFARAYSPTVLKPHVAKMSQSLVIASLFDREINCRRAASAAFQESVGRQGAQVR
jgi:tubulin-specific chaperone D